MRWHDFPDTSVKSIAMTDKEKETRKSEKENAESPIQPDPETLGPNPQEKMEGPISSIVKSIAEEGDEADPEEDIEEQEREKKEEE
jgi:hypothetical protein